MKSPSGTETSSIKSENLAETRSRELTDLITHFAPKQPIAEFFAWLEEIQKIVSSYPDNKEIQTLFAKSLKNSIRMFGERKNFADMLNLLDELDDHQNITKNEQVSEFLAEAISIAIFYLRGSWDTEGTSKLLSKLRLLIKKLPENEIVLIHYARSYSNATNRFCSDRHNFICDRLLFELRMFANKHKDNIDIQTEFAQSLTNVIGTLVKEERTEEFHRIMDELKRLASRFPKSEKIQLLVTRASILSSLSGKND